METKSSAYWQDRFKHLEESSHAYGLHAYAKIEPAFTRAQREIQKQIDSWYARFAANNEVTLSEARRLLSTRELAELRWDVDEYIKYGRQNAIDGKWMKQLENASARYHINKLEALLLRTQQELEVAFGHELDEVDKMARKVFTENYYQGVFEVQKGFNIGWEIGQIDSRQLGKVIKKPWATDGRNFSDRIWLRKQQMVGDLHQELTRTLILGKAPDEAIKHMEGFVDSEVKDAKRAASRLVMTEQAYFSSVSRKEVYKELGIKEFEIIATLDLKTSEICREMDGKHFPVTDLAPGSTAPPFHPNCRSTIAPYFEDKWSHTERIARDDENKTYYVPSDMKYKEWYNKYVEPNKVPKKRKIGNSILSVPLKSKLDGVWHFIPQGVEITNGTVIAGAGVKNNIRDIKRLLTMYGGTPEEWMKCVGKVETDNFMYDVHWYQKGNGEHFNEKISSGVLKK